MRLTLTNDPENLSLLAPFVEEMAEHFGIPYEVAFQVNLALDEALVNVVHYAYPEGTEGEIVLDADRSGDRLVLRLIDSGAPFDPTLKGDDVDTDLSAEERSIGGLGIFLIKQMMDSVTYERTATQNILTLEKKI